MPCAQISLGIMYANGQGVPQDYAEAVKWFRLAADQGDATAQFNLGIMYAKGQGVPQDYAEAVNGIASLPTRATPAPSSTSASCTPKAKASRRTTQRL